MLKRTPRELARNYLVILLAAVPYALSFDWCFIPGGVAFGGLTGAAQIMEHFLPQLSVGAWVIVLNIPLFLLGWKLLGGHLLVSSLVAMAVTSLALDGAALLYEFQPMEPMLAAIFGGVLLGASLGLIFLQGATTGGTDLIARLLKLKLAWLPMGKLILATDLVVIVAMALVFRSLESALYGLVGLYISSIVMDGVLYGLDTAKVAYIISDDPDQIAQAIIHDLDRGVTFLNGEGGWSGESKRVILCAFKQKEIVAIKETVRRADPRAFMIVTSTHEVLGEGFGRYHSEL